jgi:hypothetical protein
VNKKENILDMLCPGLKRIKILKQSLYLKALWFYKKATFFGAAIEKICSRFVGKDLLQMVI